MTADRATGQAADRATGQAAGRGTTVRFFAGARAAAGVAEEELPAGLTLAELIGTLVDRHGPPLDKVLAAAAFLVDGLAWHDRHATLPAGAEVDVLPPFAGG